MKTDKENELKMTGTCGHRISEGVASWVKQDGQLVYGTFCGDCAHVFHKQGRLVNKELSDLISNSENLSNDSLKTELEVANDKIHELKNRVEQSVDMGVVTKLNEELGLARELIRLQNDILCTVYTENSATVVKAKEFLKTKEGE